MNKLLKTIILLLFIITKLQSEEFKSLDSNKVKMIIDYVKNDKYMKKEPYNSKKNSMFIYDSTVNLEYFNKEKNLLHIVDYLIKFQSYYYSENNHSELYSQLDSINKKRNIYYQKYKIPISNVKNKYNDYQLFIDKFTDNLYYIKIKDISTNCINIDFGYLLFVDNKVELILFEF